MVTSEAAATRAASRARRIRVGAAAARAEHTPRAEDMPAVEEADRGEVDQVEEEAGVGERAHQIGVERRRRPEAPAAAMPPATGPASETRAFTHGSKRTFRSAT